MLSNLEWQVLKTESLIRSGNDRAVHCNLDSVMILNDYLTKSKSSAWTKTITNTINITLSIFKNILFKRRHVFFPTVRTGSLILSDYADVSFFKSTRAVSDAVTHPPMHILKQKASRGFESTLIKSNKLIQPLKERSHTIPCNQRLEASESNLEPWFP